jgi:cytidine deaminase
VLVVAGGTRIAEAAVIADSDEPGVPCGGCRQRLRELAASDTPIHLCSRDGERRTMTLGELLPMAFGPEHLT